MHTNVPFFPFLSRPEVFPGIVWEMRKGSGEADVGAGNGNRDGRRDGEEAKEVLNGRYRRDSSMFTKTER